MASKRFEIDMALNASDVAKGAKDGQKALADLEQAVGDVADASGDAGRDVDDFASKLVDASRKAGKSDDDIRDALRKMGYSADDARRAVDDLGDEFQDAGRKGERSVDDLEDALKDVQRQSERTEDAMDDIGDTGDKAFKKASEGAEEFKDEAQQSIKETAASFSDVTDAVDLVQEVAANAFSGFGPAGVAAGAAAAIGIGAAAAGFEAVNEAEQQSRERAAEWAQAYIEAGDKILNAAATTALGMQIAEDAEKFKAAQDNAKNWGVHVSVAIAAMSGEAWALEAANKALLESEKQVADEMAEVGMQFDWSKESMSQMTSRTVVGRQAFEQLREEMRLGGDQFDAYSRYLALVAENTEGAITKTDEFGDKVVALPDGTTIYIDAETGQATRDTDAIEKKIYGIRDKDVDVNVHAHTSRAQGDINGLISRNQGRTLTLKARVITPMGYDG
ncbi:hypothetical protein [Microbacterium sp.]|uniref:hypothetical protein n=1 Tax=Microbacterium sp. TaxID=51671 RepID=UPI00281267BE|nr:hypothetical protein [Microbacterium sp.]